MAEHTVDEASPATDRPGLGPWRGNRPPAGFVPFPAAALSGSVGDRFLAMAALFPDRTALSAPAGRWTFERLSREVMQAAAALDAAIRRPTPSPVALLATHDGPLVVAVLTVIVAGHVVVVLDPAAPVEQTRQVLAESGAPVLLHDDAHTEAARALAEASGGATRTTSLSDLAGGARSVEGPTTGLPRRTPDDPVMLAFTSGTSGGPKGAVITHRVLLNLVRGATDALGIGPDDTMPMLFPASLAVAAYPMFLPLLNGGALATFDVRSLGLAPLADFLATERITLAYMAPTVVRFLVDAVAGRDFPDLRMLALGGEVVDAEVVRLAADLFRPRWIANGFGTTETGVISLFVIGSQEVPEGDVPAGYPVPEVDLLVLDDTGAAVTPGIAGEVAVVSPHVFSGYWGHPELSRQVLGADPAGRPGWHLYRTGDLGRLDEHGALTVLGRLDTKVKVRGRFVVLGDVEAALHEQPEVGDAVVLATNVGGIVELVAHVAPAPGATVDPTALRARLLEARDAYQVPSRWEVRTELPCLPNGKVDRRALVGTDASPPSFPALPPSPSTAPPVPPADLVRALRDLWELLLPAPVVGLDDDFTHLGGDSLLAAQMLVMVDQRLGVIVPMGELVHARTIRQLASVVDKIRAEPDEAPSTVACVQSGDEGRRPRLWFVHDLQGSAYRVRHLAEHLGSDQPVWSFESPLLRGESNRFTQLDTFAALYLRDLRAVQPEGPYWLAGYSFGGICAYEMARQLERDGAEVAFVGVVDVGPGYRGPGWGDGHPPLRPWFGVAKPPPPGAGLRRSVAHYRAMLASSPKGTVRHLMVRSGLARHVDPLRFRADLARHGRVRPEWRLWYAWDEHWKLASRHWERTNDYPGPVDLFWADASPSADATMGWGPLVGSLAIHHFRSDHIGVLEPTGAPGLATALRAALDEHLGESAPTRSRDLPPKGPHDEEAR